MKVKRLPCALLLCLAVVVSAAGCAGGGTSSVQVEDSQSAERSAQAGEEAADPIGEIDIDLTGLSKTVLYSEVYNMTLEPDDYIGKVIKIRGRFDSYKDDRTGNRYYACVVQDSAGCCEEELEFVLAGDRSYPADYPKEDASITVEGVLDTYVEDHETYCTLRNAVLV